MLPKSYTSPRESTSPGSIFRKLYSCPFDIRHQRRHIWSVGELTCLLKHACSNSTWLDVVPDNAHMLVTVWASVFVPEANDVAEFMDHDAKLVTVLPNRDGLRTTAPPPDIGATSAGQRYIHEHILEHCCSASDFRLWELFPGSHYLSHHDSFTESVDDFSLLWRRQQFELQADSWSSSDITVIKVL